MSIRYDSPQEYSQLKQQFEASHAKIKHPLCYIQIHNDKVKTLTHQELYKYYSSLYCYISSTNQTPIKFLTQWTRDPTMRTYSSIDFTPYTMRETRDYGNIMIPYNLFHGFRADTITQDIATTTSNNIDFFIRYLQSLSGEDTTTYNYLIKWLAHLIQNPGELMDVALVFVAEEGNGKITFFEHFAKLLGEQYYLPTKNPKKDLFGRFIHPKRQCALLIDIDETQYVKSIINDHQLNHMITAKRINIQEQYKEPTTINNYARIVISTYHPVDVCLNATSTSRRYMIIEPDTNIHTLNRDFDQYMNDPSNQKAIMNFLRSFEV